MQQELLAEQTRQPLTTMTSQSANNTDPKGILIATSNDDNNKQNTNTLTNDTTTTKPPPKKKKPIQHLLAGGTAGFVESSICHPLDTIKTRMQLRRQTTHRKVIEKGVKKMEGRALGSMRDADATKGTVVGGGGGNGSSASGGGGGNAVTGKGALHRTSDGVKAKTTVRVKPDISAAKSNTSANATATAFHHDVGWKQRVVPTPGAGSTTTTTTVSTAAAESSAKAASVAVISSSASSQSTGNTVVAPLGPFGTARRIIQREGPLALYKGLTAVYTGIVPKMAIRFVSFEW